MARRNARGDVGGCGRSRGGGAEAIGVFSSPNPRSISGTATAGSSMRRRIKRGKGERRRRGQVAQCCVCVCENAQWGGGGGWPVGGYSWWWDRPNAEGRARASLPGAQRRWPFCWFRPRLLLAVPLSAFPFLGIPQRFGSLAFGFGVGRTLSTWTRCQTWHSLTVVDSMNESAAQSFGTRSHG